MVRNLIAVVVAFLGGGVCVTLLEMLGHVLFPFPKELDTTDMKALADYMPNAPVASLLAVWIAQCGGSLLGGAIVGWIAKHPTPSAAVYGLLGLSMAILNITLLPHPTWFIVLSTLLPIPLALLGAYLSNGFRRKTEPSPNQESMPN